METINYNCFNAGIKYLKDKYGSTKVYHTDKFRQRISKARNAAERKAIEAAQTDEDWLILHNPATDRDGHEVELLLQQYPYGYGVRRELYNKLISLGVKL
jgi:hypothetical protein